MTFISHRMFSCSLGRQVVQALAVAQRTSCTWRSQLSARPTRMPRIAARTPAQP
jgi:hypothetical protein